MAKNTVFNSDNIDTESFLSDTGLSFELSYDPGQKEINLLKNEISRLNRIVDAWDSFSMRTVPKINWAASALDEQAISAWTAAELAMRDHRRHIARINITDKNKNQ